jgi:LmbE family N-acetylglucosaminyl deacetylase
VVHDEVPQADLPVCCVGDLFWPPSGPTHDHAALLDTPARPRPPPWDVSVDVRDLGAIRREAITRHASQVEGYAPRCMVTFVPSFYPRWWEKIEEPFYEEVLP